MKSPSPQDLLTIGELAHETGASLRSIRHYDEHGLLASARASNGYRLFPAAAVTQVRQVQRLIGAGFSIAEIRSFPGCMLMVEGAAACPETAPLQHARLAAIERQMADLERRRTRLRSMLAEAAPPEPVAASRRFRKSKT